VNTDRELQLLAGGNRARRVALLVACGVFACGLLATLATPTAAPAARGLVTGLTGPGQFQSADPAERSLWFNRAVDAGAGIVRLGVSWAAVAPSQPADPTNPASYDLSSVDGAVREAATRGVKVMITIDHAPTWAEGPGRPSDANPSSWDPNPSAVANFFQAVAARYSGNFDPDGPGPEPTLPAVDALQVWNEANQDFWLAPQFQGTQLVGADRYRAILNSSYQAIKAVNPRILVVTAGTSPYGDPPGGPYPPGGARVRPVQWWQDLLCVKQAKGKKPKKKGKKTTAGKVVRVPGCTGRALFDVFAHQPIDNTGKGPLQHGHHRFDASTPDLGRVVSLLRGAERLGTLSGGRHPVWVTEFWWDSKPPNPAGAPLATQARWIQQSLYLFWKAGANTAINLTIRDTTEFPDTRNGYQGGLFFLDGRPKAALTAFRFPFVTERINKEVLRAWGKAPAAGKLVIQRKQGGRWVTIRKIQVGKGAIFLAKLRLRGQQRLRATVGGNTSLVWKQSEPATRSAGPGGGPPTATIIAAIAAIIFVVGATALQLRRHRRIRKLRRRRTRLVTG
jgi:hypothetical protein